MTARWLVPEFGVRVLALKPGEAFLVVRVASVPSSHVYIRHLSLDDDREVHRLRDPVPERPAQGASWWPPRMLEPRWAAEHAGEFDLMHIHFGFDAVAPEELAALGDELRGQGKPLVLTVHDLRNPHHAEPGLHDAQLSVLIRVADTLITLTPGAADEIGRRWDRQTVVLPHPHVVEEPTLSRPASPHAGFRIGVHAKSLRAGMDPAPDIDAIVDLLPALPGARLQVNAHTDVMTPGSARYDAPLAERARALAAAGVVDLHVHDYLSDDQLWDYLQSLDLSVLPYRFGTHSGWLEACFDLGTAVAAPDCGYYAQQRPCLSYRSGPAAERYASLQAAVLTAYQQRPRWRADPSERRAERARLAQAHREIYARALNRGVPCTS